ncbi:PREDICTED: transmembrane protein 138 isoform X1 [Colobus angolensis palliatus]|uniref:transmembrane protein 138 isoform X1 n=1 Tax=Colobus angolensis palliatus TaxID=336983 RepID=UPI0005F37346|nr:PREDICTED: transmembrane protein 138 isoform X1 [Colobus angolensis palliatus]
MLQTSNYSLVLSLQFLLLSYDLFVNSFSELLRKAPVIQLVLFIIQDIAVLFNIIIIFLMLFNTFVFQAGLVNLLFHKFKGTIILTAVYFALSISLHVWVMFGLNSNFSWLQVFKIMFSIFFFFFPFFSNLESLKTKLCFRKALQTESRQLQKKITVTIYIHKPLTYLPTDIWTSE